METIKIYKALKPCNPPIPPQFSWNDKGDTMEIPGVYYYEDDIGYYHKMGELICDAS